MGYFFGSGPTQSDPIQNPDRSVQDDSVWDDSVWDDSVQGQLSPRRFSPETGSVQDKSVPGPELSTFLANLVPDNSVQKLSVRDWTVSVLNHLGLSCPRTESSWTELSRDWIVSDWPVGSETGQTETGRTESAQNLKSLVLCYSFSVLYLALMESPIMFTKNQGKKLQLRGSL